MIYIIPDPIDIPIRIATSLKVDLCISDQIGSVHPRQNP